jgi:hypothetical protein
LKLDARHREFVATAGFTRIELLDGRASHWQ